VRAARRRRLSRVSSSEGTARRCTEQGFEEYFPINQQTTAVMFVFREARTSFRLSYDIPCEDCFLDATPCADIDH